MEYRFNTQVIHAGNTVDGTKSRAVPIHRTSSYLFDSTEHAAKLFHLEEEGNIYTRIMNPTQEVLEQRMNALEGGSGALALASGTSAVFYTIINICKLGEHIVSASNLYGGSHTMLSSILPELGISTTFTPPNDFSAVESAIDHSTRLIFTETIGNPSLDVANIQGYAEIARKNRIPLVVDSTFTTPYLFRPLEHGADIVIHSLTKWLGGHGTGIGGIVIDGGTFNWKDEKFRHYNEADPSYHGIRYAWDLPEGASPFITRLRLVPLRNLGAAISPDNAWMFLQGIETLPLRMQRHSENALQAARFLQEHEAVRWVRYPGLTDDPSYELAAKQFPKGAGGMVVFGINGMRPAGEAFINSLKLFSHLANVGDAKSLAIHPASTTHSQLSTEQQAESGITDDMVRLSVGIEDIGDILDDISQALEKSQTV